MGEHQGNPPESKWKPGKASELDDWLEAQPPLTEEELEARNGPRPKLRLRAEVLAQAAGANDRVLEVLGRLAEANKAGVVTLRDERSDVAAVAIPAEQYLELIGSYIRDRSLSEAHLDGRIGPSETVLARLGVDQVNPRDTWVRAEGYDPNVPTVE